MKKVAIVSTCFLICTVLIISCTAYQPEGKRYQIERAFFDAEKQAQNYSVKPELRTSQDYLTLVNGYKNVYSLFKTLFPDLAGKDSLTRTEMEAAYIAGQALLTASNLLVRGEQLDSAAAILDFVASASYLAPSHRSEALLLSGDIAERQGDWVDAEKLYLKLLDAFYPPVVSHVYPALEVLQLPKAIVEHYASTGDTLTARQKADWAIGYYQGIIDKFRQLPIGIAATRLLAESYNYKGEYQKSVGLLQTVVDSTGSIVDPAKGMIADLYLTRLNRKEDALKLYQDIVDKGGDSMVIASTLLKLATVKFQDKQFEDGREYLRKLSDAFPRYSTLLVQAQQLKAQSFEDQQEYDRAKQEYLTLVNEYPSSPQAIQTLVYFPEFYKKINQPVVAQQWVSKTEEKLKELIRSGSDKRTILMAASYLGTFYIRNQMYDQAISQFRELRQQFPKSVQAADALLRIALIYQVNKRDNSRAVETYREFLKQYPNSVVRQRIENEIKKLEKG